jgi:tetratricopeptide (TPR) repeat protein
LPFLAERHYREGFILNSQRRNNFAAEELEKAVQDAPWETHYQLQLGRIYEDYVDELPTTANKIEILKKAEKIYKRSIELDIMNPWYRNRLASVYISLSNFEPQLRDEYLKLAETETRLASEYDAQNPIFQINMAYFYHRFGQLDKAISYYEKVIEMDPRILEAKFNLADIYRQKGNLNKQIELYEEIYNYIPTYNNISFILANIYLSVKPNPQKAKLYLESIVSENPYILDPVKKLIRIYEQEGNFAKANKLYQRILNRFPDQIDLWKNYIYDLYRHNNLTEAKDEAAKYLNINGEDPLIRNILNSTKK